MMKKIKALLKNQKGFTLVELLAVIVILGIIGAIAVPSIGNIIENSKKDAAVQNAQQLISAARLGVASGDYIPGDATTGTRTMAQLANDGYLESIIKSPDGKAYIAADTKVVMTISSKKVTYTVTLDTTSDATIGKYDISGETLDSLNRDIVGE